MAPSRRLSNGRSPLVNPQRQITSFFSPGQSSSLKSAPSQIQCKEFTNHDSELNFKREPVVEERQKKTPLIISPLTNLVQSCSTSPTLMKPFSEEIVGRRIKVFWPLDVAWYEGYVRSFDKLSGKHLIRYDDSDEEVLDLASEQFELRPDPTKKFRRLRKIDSGHEIKTPEKEKSDEESGRRARLRHVSHKIEMPDMSSGEDTGNDDDSMDEDWRKVSPAPGDDESEEAELWDEEKKESETSIRERVKDAGYRKRQRFKSFASPTTCELSKSKHTGSKKRRLLNSSLISRTGTVLEPTCMERFTPSDKFDGILAGSSVERYGLREAEKLTFLGANRKDAKGRQPGDANYDPRTLYLPSDFLIHLSAAQRQWWEIKSKHMDKVLFFKMGKFYELFEMDAHVAARELDLQYMKGEQPHCGFPEKNFATNAEILAKKGYRILVVEQTETPEQLELRRKENGSKDKVVKREICAVITKGMLVKSDMASLNCDAAYLISVNEECLYTGVEEGSTNFGICMADVSTSKFMLGQFEDDRERRCLSSILSELRPVEIIKPSKVLFPETEAVLLRYTRNPLVNDLIPCSEFWDAEKTIDEVKNMYTKFKSHIEGPIKCGTGGVPDYLESLPGAILKLVKAGDGGRLALSALGGCLFYLRQAFLDETLLRFGKFELLHCSGFHGAMQKLYLKLDSAALENLEIFENNRDGGVSGTLYGQLDCCVTAFGKRLLKDWLARPLYHVDSICERQDAIADLKGTPSTQQFRKALSKLPDMERLLAHLFSSCEASGRNASKVILYEDASKQQLQEFISVLRGCQLIVRACSSLGSILDAVNSTLLRRLLTPGQGIPNIHFILKHFEDSFDWSEAHQSGRIIPHKGVDVAYDSACGSIMEIEVHLDKHLDEQRKLLKEKSIKYVNVGSDLYLLEVPESLQASIPQDYELRSSKKGYFRYWTSTIKISLSELTDAENVKESRLKNILQTLIRQFCEHHMLWRQLISVAAELDVLISLSVSSGNFEGPTCRPTFRGKCWLSGSQPYLFARRLGHPILRSDGFEKGSFVSNDVNIGGGDHPQFMLLTGPNMGGKSTLLRQICLAVVLAQVGADVPAESFELSPVDQVFVRMGASDHIMTGQSTFLTELSETAAMLSSASRDSLVALDELGRGTSTSDGQAIAQSVLEYFVHRIGCRCIFSTHYHQLSMDYKHDPKVALYHMACQVGKGAAGVEEVTFLYKLTEGLCPKSHGVNVARMAGLPDSVLRRAAKRSMEFENKSGKGRDGSNSGLCSYIEEDEIALIRFVVGLSSCHDGMGVMSVEMLVDQQKNSRLLLQGK